MDLISLDIISAFKSRGWALYEFRRCFTFEEMKTLLSVGPAEDILPDRKYVLFPLIEDQSDEEKVFEVSRRLTEQRRFPAVLIMEQEEGKYKVKGVGGIDHIAIVEEGLLIFMEPRLSTPGIESIVVPFEYIGSFVTKFVNRAFPISKSEARIETRGG